MSRGDMPRLHPAVDGAVSEISFRERQLRLYSAGSGSPLLLLHSVNAAASAYEVRPIFEYLQRDRQVFALDLPGFGGSSRRWDDYTIALYTGAVFAAATHLRDLTGEPRVDVLGLSLTCEFIARAALARPDLFRRLVFVTPTGFESGAQKRRAGGANGRAVPGLEATLTFGLWREGLYKALVSRPSIRFFLRRTFASDTVDPGLIDYAYASAHQPDAAFAPLAFASGKLFAGDVRTLYEALRHPVWLAHGTKGAFADFSQAG
ncbi:MAG: alpha/beta fold hydrolase, partial [Bosea sp. (in: a-proteobacteria)]